MYRTAVALDHVGMTYGTMMKPTDFACLVLKMLQISPGKDIVKEFIRQEDFKVCGYPLLFFFLSLSACTKSARESISIETKDGESQSPKIRVPS